VTSPGDRAPTTDHEEPPSCRPKTIVEKIWEQHVVRSAEGSPDLLYVDLHLVHEVTSPQAFDGLRVAGRTVRRPDLTLATMDHNVPTDPRQVRGELPIADELSAKQIEALRQQLRGVRHQAVRHGQPQPGHRAHHRSGARADPAGCGDRVR
jgi:homoaconitase/3-isopropylmalate dehydratase large subunit